MTARKEYKERVCKEEGCKRIFFPKHHQQTRCSDECRAKAVKDKNQRHMDKVKADKAAGAYAPFSHVRDGMERGNSFVWKGYMEANPIYFRGLFPKSTIPEAAILMRAWGLRCR